MAFIPIGPIEPPSTANCEDWRLRPCDWVNVKDDADRLERINQYFTDCAKFNRRPLLTGASMAAGYSGVTEMRRAAMRDPTMRHALSRVFTTIASFYEEMIGTVSGQGPIFMLKNMPDYDDLAPVSAPAQRAFQDRLVVEERVTGVMAEDEEEADLSPRLAYLKLIKGQTLENEDIVEMKNRIVTGMGKELTRVTLEGDFIRG